MMTLLKRAPFLALIFLTAIPALSALADDPPRFKFQYSEFITEDEKASLTLVSNLALSQMNVIITRDDGKEFTFSKKNVSPNKELTFSWKQKKGARGYSYIVESTDSVGFSSTSRPVDFSVTKTGKLKVKVDTDNVDLENGSLEFTSTNPVAEAHLQIFDEDQKLITEAHEIYDGGATGTLSMTWEAEKSRIAYMDLKVTDVGRFWAAIRLTPFSIGIDPEEHPQFETNSADLLAAEEAKLQEPLDIIKKQLKKCEPFGCLDTVKLYIGGYTDTVGNEADNRALSQRRARTIARYFRAQGLELPIYFQGFGEDVLAVTTPDGTDEIRNRRAYYVLTNAAPRHPQFPRQSWKRLK